MSDPDNPSGPATSATRQLCLAVAALATAPGRGAIATVLVRGPGSAAAVAKLCRTDESVLIKNPAHARLHIIEWNNVIGERVVIHCYSEDNVEIHCHGGMMPSQLVLTDLATTAGIETVPWRELTRLGTQSTIKIEAIEALTEAATTRAASILLDQYHGALETKLHEVVRLLERRCNVEAQARLVGLLDYAELGTHLVRPWRVAIVGRPNVGKSSLLNALLGYNRAIVYSTPGTTRDVVSATTAVDGWPVILFDTAGIREPSDEVESAGIDRSLNTLNDSDSQIFVCDTSEPFAAEDSSILAACNRPIIAANKADLAPRWRPEDHSMAATATCARSGNGVGELLVQLAACLVPKAPEPREAVPSTERQVIQLRRALEMLNCGDVVRAMEHVSDCIDEKVRSRTSSDRSDRTNQSDLTGTRG